MKLQEDIEGRLQRSEQGKGETTAEDTESQSTMHSITSQDMDSTLKASSAMPMGGGEEKVTQQRHDALMGLLAEERDRRGMELEQARTLDRISHQEVRKLPPLCRWEEVKRR